MTTATKNNGCMDGWMDESHDQLNDRFFFCCKCSVTTM